MYFNQSNSKAIGSNLVSHLKFQSKAILPLLKPIARVSIVVEKIGFTRNASNTPYIVYRVNDRRCCTFVKRRWFFECVQLLLLIKDGIEPKIRSIRSTSDFGISILTTESRRYITRSYLNKFFTSLNSVAVNHTVPDSECGCDDLFNLCPHRIAAYCKYFYLL